VYTINLNQLPPLSLYVHIPWCVRKCPYCDFNSHAAPQPLPWREYISALQQDLDNDARLAQGRPLKSIFFGGGTPSLMPGELIAAFLETVTCLFAVADDCEITLEANPGTAEFDNFSAYREAGVNRLSIGAQSFNAGYLEVLERIHQPDDIQRAFALAREADFSNINLDLMFGLPGQRREEAMQDLRQAIALEPEHISWYQLTIEPNTIFYSKPPRLPDDDCLWTMQEDGQTLLQQAGYQQYEISAYARHNRRSQHNLNYWEFGDYLAVGAGAHGKISHLGDKGIQRLRKIRMPDQYLAAKKNQAFTAEHTWIEPAALPSEFMLNALRLKRGVKLSTFSERTGLSLGAIKAPLEALRQQGLLKTTPERLQTSAQGFRYLNNTLEYFL